jgi:hypothetical protein
VPYAPSGVEIVTLFEDMVLEAPRDVQLRGLWDRMLDEHAGEYYVRWAFYKRGLLKSGVRYRSS